MAHGIIFGLLDYNIALVAVHSSVGARRRKIRTCSSWLVMFRGFKALGEAALSLSAQLTSNLRKLNPKSAIQAAILNRFADVLGRDLGLAIQIGDGA